MIADGLKATPPFRRAGSVRDVFVNTNNVRLERNRIDKKTALA